MEHFVNSFHDAAAAQLPLSTLGAAVPPRTLQPWTFTPLPLGSISPGGWLLDEMQTTGAGLAGHELDFYLYVNKSSWLNTPGSGGQEYSSLNEALPYWFNGLVPLAYGLNDSRLIDQVSRVANTVLGFQADDGWIGPEVGSSRNFWARTPLFLGLTQLAEADSSWEDPVLKGLRAFMPLANQMLKNNSQGFTNCAKNIDCTWGQARVHDLIITIQWLLEKYPSDQDSLLWENMDLFYSQSTFKWDQWYVQGTFPQVADPGNQAIWPYIHGVNVGQGLKFASVIWRINGTQSLLQTASDAVTWSFQYHGSSSGSILADEHEHDLAPYMGSELCTAVETAYSLSYMYQVHGDPSYADRAERTIFNAYPVMLYAKNWAHQYMDQPNQPYAIDTIQNGKIPQVFTTSNNGVANTYGTEPFYPCCTVNHPQGYPKFTSNSWVAYGTDGLVHALLSPSTVNAVVNGGSVTVTCDTNYPFSNTLTYTVESRKNFNLYLRMPNWADQKASQLAMSGATSRLSQSTETDSASGLVKIPLSAGKTTVTYILATDLRVEDRTNNTVSVYYGNLLYALEIGMNFSSSSAHPYYNPRGSSLSNLPFPQLQDWSIAPTTSWNVAIDPSTLQYFGMNASETLPPGIFEPGSPLNYMTVDGCEISGWNKYMNATPDWPPETRTCSGDKQSYRLVPYGSAKLHMADIPTITF